VWSAVCFLARPGFRWRGVAAALLSATVSYARDRGVPALEEYPVEAAGSRIDSTFAFVDTAGMFEAAGFRGIAGTGARSAGRPPCCHAA
jgi:GNAT superfamily N-acetyltransferase